MRARASWAAMYLAGAGVAACSAPSSGLGDVGGGFVDSGAAGSGSGNSTSADSGGLFPPATSGGAGPTGSGGSGSSSTGGGSDAGDAGSTGTAGAGGTSGGGGANTSGAGTSNAGGSGTGSTAGTGGAGGAGCRPLTFDCNTDPSDGCETNIGDDINNCGACNNVCPTRTNATPDCFIGECINNCAGDSGDCNRDPNDGCEANTLTDPSNCGACGMSCGNSQCVDGACSCATTSVTATKVPLDIYIMFDSSGSMEEDVAGGTKWDVIKNALIGFVNNTGSAEIGVGIGYFPVETCSFIFCSTSCNLSDYSSAAVGIGVLPGQAPAIVNSLNGRATGGNTPTSVALRGAYAYAIPWQVAHPDRKTIVVLATDGEPTSCDPQDPATIGSTIVAPALAGNPSILTFVIGVGSSLTSLNTLAAAGGTGQAFIVDTASDPGGQFLAAMNAIRGSQTLGCEYQIPSPPGGGAPDYTRVNVQYTPPAGSPFTLRKVADVGACTVQNGGWYYDNPTTPTRIELCPSTCSAVGSGANGARIDVLLGCPSTE